MKFVVSVTRNTIILPALKTVANRKFTIHVVTEFQLLHGLPRIYVTHIRKQFSRPRAQVGARRDGVCQQLQFSIKPVNKVAERLVSELQDQHWQRTFERKQTWQKRFPLHAFMRLGPKRFAANSSNYQLEQYSFY